MPLGTLILRLLGWTRIHGINQTFASILGMTGAGVGIYMSTLYNRVSYSLEFLQATLTLHQEQEIQLWPSSARSPRHISDAHPTRPRHNAPSHLQTNPTNHKNGTHTRLARPHRHRLRHSQRFPVSNLLSPTYPIPTNPSPVASLSPSLPTTTTSSLLSSCSWALSPSLSLSSRPAARLARQEKREKRIITEERNHRNYSRVRHLGLIFGWRVWEIRLITRSRLWSLGAGFSWHFYSISMCLR
jgi:hypothetical protein